VSDLKEFLFGGTWPCLCVIEKYLLDYKRVSISKAEAGKGMLTNMNGNRNINSRYEYR
jgi:hypothetical protein